MNPALVLVLLLSSSLVNCRDVHRNGELELGELYSGTENGELELGELYSGTENGEVREPNEGDIHFFLFTRTNGEEKFEIGLNIESLFQAGYNPSNPTIIVVHGYTSEGYGFGIGFVRAFFEVGDFNVISVDWGKLALWYDYFGAAYRTRFVGEHVGSLIAVLAENGGIQRLHLVGHSLGAHVVGFAGKFIQEQGYGKIPRITGLDPAQPGFDLAGANGRLDKEDADFVDVIHVNSGMLWEGCLSITKMIGHIDFYPAGGKHQPSCTDLCFGGETCSNNTLNDLIKGGCSHGRANTYFMESIVSEYSGNRFLAWPCDSWEQFVNGECCNNKPVPMGHGLHKGVEGSYMLNVGEESPFALEENGNFC